MTTDSDGQTGRVMDPASPDLHINGGGETSPVGIDGADLDSADQTPTETQYARTDTRGGDDEPYPPLRSQADIGADDDDGAPNSRRNRRKFAVNQRGFLGVQQSMVTAKLVDEFQLLQVLGQGFYGKVFLATSVNKSSGESVAIKQLDERKFPPEIFPAISSEFATLHKIIHPNIVSYKRVLLDANTIYVATEFVENGSLFDIIQKNGPLPETTVASYTKQILNALAHLQDLKIVHRDLKCSNVLVTKSGECKITDFELSHKHESNRYTIRGAPFWMAPEVIEMTAAPTCSSDIWSLGCLVIEMATGEPPYKRLGPMTALLSISRDEHPPFPEHASEYMVHFLRHCFAKNPDVRHDAKTLRQHPWFSQAPTDDSWKSVAPRPPSTLAPSALSHGFLSVPHRPAPAESSSPSTTATTSPFAIMPSPPSVAQTHPYPGLSISPSSASSGALRPSSPTAAAQPPHPVPSLSPSPPSPPVSHSPPRVHSYTATKNAPSPAAAITQPQQPSNNNNNNNNVRPQSPPSSGQQQANPGTANIVIDVYSDKDKEDFELLEMTTNQEALRPAAVDEMFRFWKSPATAPSTPGQSEVAALRAEVAVLRELNDANVELALQLKDMLKKQVEVDQRLIDLCWRLRERSDTAMDNIRQAAKSTSHSNMLLKRTNQVATEALAHGTIVTANMRKLEEYILESDPSGKKLVSVVYRKTITTDSIINPSISGYLYYCPNLRTWKKDKERRAWFVLKDNFLFAFKSDKGSSPPLEVVYLGDGARLVPLSEEQCKRKCCFRLGDLFLIGTETAELYSEWMLALSRPQRWYESSIEESTLSPRALKREDGSAEISNNNNNSNGSSGNLTSTSSSKNKGRKLSGPSLPASASSGSSSTGSINMNSGNAQPVFGVSLDELFGREGGNVPYFFSRMIQFLEEKALLEEGILRLSGSLGEINQLKDALQHGEDVDFYSHDPHAVTGLLKVFFRELPSPLIPDPYHSRILEVMFNQDMLDEQRVVEVKMILDQMPHPNHATLKILMGFLVKVNCSADKNKMTIQNLITCMVPTLKCVPGVFMYVIPNYDFVFDIE